MRRLLIVANLHLTLELADRIDALPKKPIYQPNLPCGAIPMRLVMDHPMCAQKLLESMNVTNVRIHPRGTPLPEMDRAREIMRNLSRRYARLVNGSGRSVDHAE